VSDGIFAIIFLNSKLNFIYIYFEFGQLNVSIYS